MPLDVARRGTLDVRDPPLKAIVADNDNYEAGYHKGNAGGLDAIDTDLATANIKNGITIFGKVGSADVFDISDATAIEAEVLDPETFYAVGGGIRIGTMPTVALAPDSSAYPAGYHVGDGGGLPAIDADLATGNIKSGITIFNVAGHNNVRDISDADLVEAEAPTGKFFYAVSGGIRTGSGTKTLSDANDTVAAGYYAATTLHDVDAQLAAANIKSGVIIFGFTGPATVQDIGDATAGVGDVKDTVTFYSVTGVRKTGTMPTVALAADSSAYPTGYHAGDVGGLPAVDANLVTGSIKSGVTIFNVAGHNDVRDISDGDLVEAEAPTGKFFYAGSGGKRTGTGTKTLSDANDTVAAGYYAATTLHDVDAHLASINIKAGVTIFGFAGNANVVDTSSGDAVPSDIKAGKKAWVDGAEVTGDIPEVAIVAGSEAVPAGIHTATTLSTIDGDLAVGNIKSGVIIFGFTGAATIQDISDANAAVGEVLSPKTFFSVTGAIKTGTMPTKAIVAANDLYEEGYHAGNPGGLDAIDVHLAPGNIKKDVNIFGKVGTYDPVPSVTELFYQHAEKPAGDDGLTLKQSGEVPATAKHICAFIGAWQEGADCGAAIYYNNVEKVAIGKNVGVDEGSVVRWDGAGLGFAADIDAYGDWFVSQDNFWGTGCWYIE